MAECCYLHEWFAIPCPEIVIYWLIFGIGVLISYPTLCCELGTAVCDFHSTEVTSRITTEPPQNAQQYVRRISQSVILVVWESVVTVKIWIFISPNFHTTWIPTDSSHSRRVCPVKWDINHYLLVPHRYNADCSNGRSRSILTFIQKDLTFNVLRLWEKVMSFKRGSKKKLRNQLRSMWISFTRICRLFSDLCASIFPCSVQIDDRLSILTGFPDRNELNSRARTLWITPNILWLPVIWFELPNDQDTGYRLS